jgi:predicted lipoprotein with Yx(FWY)xxD motif
MARINLPSGRRAVWIAAAVFAMAAGGAGAALAQGLYDATAVTGAARPAAVRVEMTDEMGPVLADANGHSLYTWAGDKKPGVSECDDTHYTHANGAGSMSYELPEAATRPTCVHIWPPFIAAADAKPVGEWSVIKRKDGSSQWAYNNRPLYTFVEDHQAGDINGIGSSGRFLSGRYPLWAPLGSPSGVIAQVTEAGRVLMTDKGKVLYTAKPGGLAKASFCAGPCAAGGGAAWAPLAAPAIADTPPKGWTIVDLPTGGRQWVFQGKPLYTYAGDNHFADLNGADEPGWQPATLQKPLAPPPEFSIQMTADGPVFADQNGLTLYSYGCSDEAPDRGLCDIPGGSDSYRRSLCGTGPVCINTWRPVVASKDAKPVGHTWSIVTIDPTGANQYLAPGQKDGIRVWAYRGRPIYTFVGDKEAGDMYGNRVNGGIWQYGMVRADGGDRLGF